MNAKQRFYAACRAQPVDRPPVWLMRQAGRSLPEYRELKELHSFQELMTTPELAAEVTLQPLRRFRIDAAIIFSDILVVPAAMGMEVSFEGGLSLSPAIKDSGAVKALRSQGIRERLDYVARALEIVHAELGGEKALLGFAGAPFTVASYMVEGGSSKSYSRLKSLMYQEPAVFDLLLSTVADATVEYLRLQIECGVDAVQLFDSWASELSPKDYRTYALPYVKQVTAALQDSGVPVIYFINGVSHLLEDAYAGGADVIGVDWRISLSQVRKRLGQAAVVQGNLDPGLLFAAPEEIRLRTRAMIDETGGVGHIANLGHGVTPETPLKGIETFVNAVCDWQPGVAGQGGV